MKKKLMAVCLACGLLLPGCELLQSWGIIPAPTPQELLIGTWKIDPTKTDPAGAVGSTHYKIRFTSNQFVIEDSSGNAIEKDDITAIDDLGFYCTILVYTPDPNYVGGQNYALYDVDRNTLKVAFYDDDTLATRFVTFYCDRVE